MTRQPVAALEVPLPPIAVRALPASPPLPTFDVRELEQSCAALLARLGIEPASLRGASVADVHGMGTLALACAVVGARVTSIAHDDGRADWTARLFQRQRQTVKITSDFAALEFADVVVFGDGDAPMHDPLARLPRVLRAVGKNASVVAFIPERHARLRHVLRCRVLAQIAKSRDEFVRSAYRLFPRVTDAWSKRDPYRAADQSIFERVAGPLPHLPTRREVLDAASECGAIVRAVDPSAGLEPTDATLDEVWTTWRGGETGGAAELDALERRIAARDYDEQHLRILDAPGELERVAFRIEPAAH